MRCYYCKKAAVGMKATDYYDTSPTCFRFLCKTHWHEVETKFTNEEVYRDN